MSETDKKKGSKRALLIGSPVGALTGPATDLDLMGDILKKYGFCLTRCSVEQDAQYPATRKGILAAWEHLIEQSSPADAVVVYYTGHGGLTEKPDEDKDERRRWRLQFLVPFDFHESRKEDFRGITDFEISDFLIKLTAKTDNVTMILDCCHSARMARRPATPKAINSEDYPEVSVHIQRLAEQRIGAELFPEGNPNVVRVVAAATSESAWEREFADHKRMGVLTEALTEALAYAFPSQVSWRSILLRIRDRISRTMPGQYTQVEGPADRLLFRTETEVSRVRFPINRRQSGYVLAAGRLHGVSKGDQFAVAASIKNATLSQSDVPMATAEVVQLGGATSGVRLEWKNATRKLPDGAQATLVKKVQDQLPVSVRGEDGFVTHVTTYLKKSDFLRPAEQSENQSALATIAKSELSQVTVRDTQGSMLRDWKFEKENEVRGLIERSMVVLRKFARAHHVLSLEGERTLSECLDVEFGTVAASQSPDRTPITSPQHALHPGNRVYIKLRNDSPNKALFVSIIDITGENVTLLNDTSPDGIELRANDGSYVFGEVDFNNTLIGSKINWPDDVPPKQKLPVAVVLVITETRIDLRGLNTTHTREKGGTCPPVERSLDAAASDFESDLLGKLELLKAGTVRVRPASQDTHVPLRFGVKRIFYQLEGSQ